MSAAKRPHALHPQIVAMWLAWIGLSFCIAAMGQTSAPNKGDSRMRFVSPTEGQRFTPGDTVVLVVRATVPLAAIYAGVGMRGAGMGLPGAGVLVLAPDADGVTYRAKFVIPHDFVGSAPLTVGAIDSKGNPFSGPVVTIVVQPPMAPQSLRPISDYQQLFSVGRTEKIYLTGNYPDGSTYDLSSSVTGTVYASSDPQVIVVDAEGNVKAAGFGTASVRATNGGARTFVNFVVEDPARPLPPQDLTARATFERSPLELDANLTSRQKTPIYAQTITITNTSDWPVIGRLYLTVRDLPKDAWLFGSSPGRPVYYMPLRPKDGLTLGPGERVTATLQFWALRSPTPPEYRLGIIRYAGDTGRIPLGQQSLAANDVVKPIEPTRPLVPAEIYRGNYLASGCALAKARLRECVYAIQNNDVHPNVATDAFNAGLYFKAWLMASSEVAAVKGVTRRNDDAQVAMQFFKRMKEYQAKLGIDNRALCEATQEICANVLQNMEEWDAKLIAR